MREPVGVIKRACNVVPAGKTCAQRGIVSRMSVDQVTRNKERPRGLLAPKAFATVSSQVPILGPQSRARVAAPPGFLFLEPLHSGTSCKGRSFPTTSCG